MTTRKGRRIAIVTVLAVIVIAGVLLWFGRDHIRFLLAFESLGPNAQGYAEYRHRQTGIVFVSLPGGTFLMGSPAGEEGRRDHEGPVHEVTLSAFLVGKYEVTQAQWEAVMENNPAYFKGADSPVERVSWEDCQEFCSKTELALPTEAQWEYACRAGTTGRFAGTGKLEDIGWWVGNSGDGTHPVGNKAPNQFGLYDMHGNVFEWCEDRWDDDFYMTTEASVRRLAITSSSGNRMVRGGCWRSSATGCRSGFPLSLPTWHRGTDVGFRPAARRP